MAFTGALDQQLAEELMDVAFNEISTVGRDVKLASKKVGLVDAFWLDAVASLYNALEKSLTSNVRPYWCDWVDTQDCGTVNPQLGRQLTFKLDLQQHAQWEDTYVHFTVEATGGSGWEFQPWIGHALLGDNIRVQYSSNQLRQYSADFLNALQRMTHDQAHQRWTDYKKYVGAEPVEGRPGIYHFAVKLWLPWGSESKQCLISSALPSPVNVMFTPPLTASLVRRSAAAAAGGLGTWTAPALELKECKIRSHIVELEKAERAAHVQITQAVDGLSWMHHDVEAHERERANFEGVVNAGRGQETTRHFFRLDNFKNSSAYIMAIARYEADLNDATTDAHPDMTGADVNISTNHPRPQRYGAECPIQAWHLEDGGRLFSSKRTYKFWQDQERSQYFDCEPNNIAVIPWSKHPLVENMGLGHVTISNLNNPRMVLEIASYPTGPGANDTSNAHELVDPFTRSNPALDPVTIGPLYANRIVGDSDAAAQLNKRVDLWSVVKQRFNQIRGECIPQFHV